MAENSIDSFFATAGKIILPLIGILFILQKIVGFNFGFSF